MAMNTPSSCQPVGCLGELHIVKLCIIQRHHLKSLPIDGFKPKVHVHVHVVVATCSVT